MCLSFSMLTISFAYHFICSSFSMITILCVHHFLCLYAHLFLCSHFLCSLHFILVIFLAKRPLFLPFPMDTAFDANLPFSISHFQSINQFVVSPSPFSFLSQVLIGGCNFDLLAVTESFDVLVSAKEFVLALSTNFIFDSVLNACN